MIIADHFNERLKLDREQLRDDIMLLLLGDNRVRECLRQLCTRSEYILSLSCCLLGYLAVGKIVHIVLQYIRHDLSAPSCERKSSTSLRFLKSSIFSPMIFEAAAIARSAISA